MKWLSIVLLGAISCSGNPQGCSNTILYPNDDVWCHWPLAGLFGLKVGGIAAPDPVKNADDGAGSSGVYSACFASNATESIFDNRVLPHDISGPTDVTTRFVWYPADGTAGNVRWCQESMSGAPGYDFDSNTTNKACITSAASETQGIGVEVSINSTGLPLTKDMVSQFHFWRAYDDAADTYGADACIVALQVYYKCDRVGLGVLP